MPTTLSIDKEMNFFTRPFYSFSDRSVFEFLRIWTENVLVKEAMLFQKFEQKCKLFCPVHSCYQFQMERYVISCTSPTVAKF